MRRIKHTAVVPLVVFALMAGCNHTTNPTTPEQTPKTEQAMNDVRTLQDKLALRELVETFATLADVKDVDTQMTLFTEDAVVEGYAAGKPTGRNFVGKEAIGNAFKGYLRLFHTIYHLNGQHTSHIEGNRATATTYCYVTLMREVEGKEEKTVHYAIYNNEFVKREGKWLIAKRKSNFVRTEVSSEK